MRCEHAETTTLLWLYGEADESHAEHVAGCADCLEVADMHVDVAVALAPVAPALAVEAPPVRRWPVFAAGLALAAIALIGLRLATLSPAPTYDTVAAVAPPTPAVEPAVSELLADDLDDDLDALSVDLDTLTYDIYDL